LLLLFIAAALRRGVQSRTQRRSPVQHRVGGLIRVPPGFVQIQAVNGDGVVVGQIGVQSAPSVLTYSVMVRSRPM